MKEAERERRENKQVREGDKLEKGKVCVSESKRWRESLSQDVKERERDEVC